MLNGILTVGQGVSRVDGVPLAICGAADPFGSATNFLAGRGFGNGSHVIVSGSAGTIGDTAVFCMTDVHAAAVVAQVDEGAVGKMRKRAARKAAGTKRGAKKTVAKKRAVKTAAKKRTGKNQLSARKSSRRARKPKARAATTKKGSRKR